MTDINDTHTDRFFETDAQQTILEAVLAAATKLGVVISGCVQWRVTEDRGALAERVLAANSIREKNRRDVDRLMM